MFSRRVSLLCEEDLVESKEEKVGTAKFLSALLEAAASIISPSIYMTIPFSFVSMIKLPAFHSVSNEYPSVPAKFKSFLKA